MMAGEYEIQFSAVRARKGLKPYAVMEIVDENFSRGISQHSTKEEAALSPIVALSPPTAGRNT